MAKYKLVFNPITGKLDLVNSSTGGGGVTGIDWGNSYLNYNAMIASPPAANTLNYVKESQGTKWLPFSLGGTYYPMGWYYFDGTNYSWQEVPFQASIAMINAMTNDDSFITPYGFANSDWANKINTSW